MKAFTNLFLAAFMILLIACEKDDSVSVPIDEVLGDGVVKIITNNSGGSVSTDNGSKIVVPAGAIGTQDNGSNGNISFSIENDIKLSELALPLPTKYQLVGGVIKFSPSSFIFSSPILVYLPASALSNLEGVSILRLNEKENIWVTVPISDIDASKKLLGVSTFELGYFAVVQDKELASKSEMTLSPNKSGGLLMEHPGNNDYYYTILVVGFVPKYAQDISANQVIGSSGHTGGKLGSDGPASFTRLGGIPQGTYQLEISRMRRGTLSTLPGQTEYYSQIITTQVNGFSNTLSWDWANWSGWTTFTISGGSWISGRPTYWPTADKPFGTGEFQATLTWVNTDNSATDLDLHLFGPSDTHVFWSESVNLDESIVLDRDWMSETGYATENIYSTKSMPKGNYGIYVNAFGGTTPKNYEVRIILRGATVKTFRGTVNSTSRDDDTKANMTAIHSFNI